MIRQTRLGPHDFVSGISFARAVVAHFALPPDTHANMSVNCGPDECFSIAVTLTLTADDLAAIADRMEGRTAPSAFAETAAPAFRLTRRCWPERFWLSYKGWRKDMGVRGSLRAAWRISR